MSFVEIIILAIIQGFTEFLPISSSGHLALLQNIFAKLKGTTSENATLDILLHFGTLIATIFFFRKEIVQLTRGFFSKEYREDILFHGHERKIIFLIALSIIPTALMGFLFEPFFEGMIDNTLLVSIMLLATGFILFTSKFFYAQKNKWDFGILAALIIGLAQGFSILPGLSRSGLTIATALMLGVNRESAFKFSFLISMPAILGATLLKIKDLNFYDTNVIQGYIIGMVITAVVGYVSLIILGKMVLTKKFYRFAYYCLTIGVLAMILSFYDF